MGARGTQSYEEDELAKTAQPIVRAVVRKVRREIGYRVDASDLASIANEVLVGLVRRYDPSIAPFAPYLARNLRWAVLDRLRRRRNRPLVSGRVRGLQALDRLRDTTSPKSIHRAPLSEKRAQRQLRHQLRLRATATALPLLARQQPLGEPQATSATTASPEQQYQGRQVAEAVRKQVASLEDETEKAILTRHYFKDEPFNQIASSLGLSKWQACRIHKRALERLAEHFGTATFF